MAVEPAQLALVERILNARLKMSDTGVKLRENHVVWNNDVLAESAKLPGGNAVPGNLGGFGGGSGAPVTYKVRYANWRTDHFVDRYLLDQANTAFVITANTRDTLTLQGQATGTDGYWKIVVDPVKASSKRTAVEKHAEWLFDKANNVGYSFKYMHAGDPAAVARDEGEIRSSDPDKKRDHPGRPLRSDQLAAAEQCLTYALDGHMSLAMLGTDNLFYEALTRKFEYFNKEAAVDGLYHFSKYLLTLVNSPNPIPCWVDDDGQPKPFSNADWTNINCLVHQYIANEINLDEPDTHGSY